MSDHPQPRTLTRPLALAAACCLVVPAALNVGFHLLTPVDATSLPVALAQAAASPDRAATAASLQLALPVLALGVLALGWRASAGAPRLAAWGAVLLVGGYLLGTSDTFDNVLQAVVPAYVGPASALRVVQGFEGSLPGHLGALAIVGQAPGLILMGLALWRSRAVPRVLAGCFLATLPLHVLTHSTDANRLPALSWGWFTLVLVGCAVVILRDARAAAPTTTPEEPPADPWPTGPAATTMSV